MARRTNLRKVPRQRRRIDPNLPKVLPNVAVSSFATTAATTATLTLAGPVNRIGTQVPSITATLGTTTRTLASITQSAANVLTCTFSGAIGATYVYAIPERDPALRTPGGGYIAGSGNTFQ